MVGFSTKNSVNLFKTLFQYNKYKYSKWLGHQVTCIIVLNTASYWRFTNLLTLMLPFCPSNALCFLPNPFPFFPVIFHAHPTPSPTGGSESGRSTPSLSTYSDGKSPSSTSTYVAAPRHFHIPGRPWPHHLGCDSTFNFSYIFTQSME